MQTEWFIND